MKNQILPSFKNIILTILAFSLGIYYIMFIQSCSSADAHSRLNQSPSHQQDMKDTEDDTSNIFVPKVDEKERLIIDTDYPIRNHSWEDELLKDYEVKSTGSRSSRNGVSLKVQKDYIELRLPVISSMNRTGLFDGTLMTLYSLESHYGQSKLALNAGNHAGVKGDFRGKSYWMYDDCRKVIGKKKNSKPKFGKAIPCAFREYITPDGKPSFYMFQRDYNDWWTKRQSWDLYKDVFAAKNVKEQLIALAKSPYASEGRWKRQRKLMTIAKKHNLFQYNTKGISNRPGKGKYSKVNVSPKNFGSKRTNVSPRKSKGKIVFGLDTGHGWNTPGKRVTFKNPVCGRKVWHEHKINASISEAIFVYAKSQGINIEQTYTLKQLAKDKLLHDRAKKFDAIGRKYQDRAFHTSVHHNAIRSKVSDHKGHKNCQWHHEEENKESKSVGLGDGATGTEVFHHPNSKWGKRWAEILNEEWVKELGKLKNRGVKTPPKKFTVIYKTQHPTVIMEYSFYDSPEQIWLIMNYSPVKVGKTTFRNHYHKAAAISFTNAAKRITKEYNER